MILDLMKAQARAHRGYLAWTAAMLTLGVSLAGYAAFSAAQQDAVDMNAAEAYGLAGGWSRDVYVTALGDGASTMRGELDAALDAADAEGAETAAMLRTSILTLEVPGRGSRWSMWSVAGTRGNVDWDTLLLSGEAPGPGEVALDAWWESQGGVAIGDPVEVHGEVWYDEPEWEVLDLGTLTVSGFLRPGAEGRYAIQPPDAVLAWDDAWDILHSWHEAQTDPEAALWGDGVEVGAQAVTPALEAVGGSGWSPWFGSSRPSGRIQVLAVTSIVLAVAMIGMAFAVGRSQAQSRTGWVATARVLGARRSAIAAAAAAEVLLVGLFAGVLGTAIAWGAVAAEYATFAASHPDSLIPAGLELAPWLPPAIASLGLVMAAILGAIPAFWAARVPPAAALRPVVPVTEAPAGPRAPSTWIYGAWVALFLTLVMVAWPSHLTGARLTAVSVLAPAVVIATVPMLMRTAGLLVAHAGRRLAGGVLPWEVAAGDALLGRLRIAALPAGVVAIGVAALTGAVAWHVLAAAGELEAGGSTLGAWGWLPAGSTSLIASMFSDAYMAVALTGLGVLVLVAFAAFASGARASEAEDEARRALGLAAGTARAAMALRFAVPVLIGVGLGVVTGVAGVLLTFHGPTFEEALPLGYEGVLVPQVAGPAWALAHAGNLIAPLVAMALTAVAATATGAVVAAATMVRSSQPQKESLR
ncbi:FtsX-like permease family protein [Demequina subtropica]|uniref:FtsX-like permease family protein n=1 Tax=Demequina subtropica TaxID=1638989 RepID=UPI000784E0AB|nr:FtsX-like permease family protein [Demequina subtropica]